MPRLGEGLCLLWPFRRLWQLSPTLTEPKSSSGGFSLALRYRRKEEALGESERVAARVIDVELTSAPALVDRSFVNHLGRVRVPRRGQPPFPELAEQRIHVVGQDSDRLTERPVPAVAGQKEVIPAPGEDA